MQEKMIFEHKLFKSLSCVGDEVSLNLMPNLGFIRKILLASFSNHLLKNV